MLSKILRSSMRALRVNKTNITTKIALHRDKFVTEGNQE